MSSVTLLLLSGSFTSLYPAFSASANSEPIPQTSKTEAMLPTSFDGISAPKGSVSHNGNDTIVTITDDAMISYYEQQGYSIPVSLLGRSAHNSVTKIIWHGAAKHGNFDLYLSKNTLTLYHALLAAGNLGMIIVNAYFANYPEAALSMVNAIKNTVKAGHTTSGKHYKVRHWSSINVYNQ